MPGKRYAERLVPGTTLVAGNCVLFSFYTDAAKQYNLLAGLQRQVAPRMSKNLGYLDLKSESATVRAVSRPAQPSHGGSGRDTRAFGAAPGCIVRTRPYQAAAPPTTSSAKSGIQQQSCAPCVTFALRGEPSLPTCSRSQARKK